jgi:hypothetical protein
VTRDVTAKPAYVATYPARVPVPGTQPTKFRDLRCFRGPVSEVRALVAMTVASNPGAAARYEQDYPGLDQLYVEVLMPLETP